MSKRDSLIECIFSTYVEGNETLKSDLDTENDRIFYEYYGKIESGEADPEELSGVQYAAARAAFYAGFNAAKELLK